MTWPHSLKTTSTSSSFHPYKINHSIAVTGYGTILAEQILLISAVSIQTYEWKCIVKNKKKYIDVISFQETYDITVICMRLRLVLFWLLFLCLLTWLHIAESNLCENEKKKISIKVVAWFCICCKLKKKKHKMTKKKKMKNVLRQLLQNWTHFCFLSCTKMLSLATMHIVIIHRGWSSSLTHSAIL